MFSKYRKILLAMVSRALFTIHGVMLVWRVVQVKQNSLYWMLLIGLLLLGVEMAVTLSVTRKGEWKWFSPMVFLYLCSTVPSVFLLELDLVQTRISITNSTANHILMQGMNLSQPSQWLVSLEQIMILVLVLGRWLMPKGEMNRDQLTQLLLIYIALGADILDILNLIKSPAVETNWIIAVVGLSLFSCALLQFTLALTQSFDFQDPNNDQESDSTLPARGRTGSCSCSSEQWSLVLGVVLQDGPFLVFRLYLAIAEKVNDEMMIFFICKNILTVIIEIYRIIIIQVTKSR
uniref:Transmembrane protein 26 n=1 Tax=Leptobrachium leishanense TaxID=445787 RepID=A0A8C5MZM7_9ANUR